MYPKYKYIMAGKLSQYSFKFLDMKILLFFFLTVNCLAQAPTIEWQIVTGGYRNDYISKVALTSDGGYIVIGSTESTDSPVLGNHGIYDIWVLKMTASGTIQWKKAYGSSGIEFGTDIKQTTDGGYIMCGYTFGPFNGNGDVTGNHGGEDYWIIKINAVGTIQWQKNIGGQSYDRAYSVIQTNDGGYIVSGSSFSSDQDFTSDIPQSRDFWLVKFDVIGNIEWKKGYGGYDNYGEARTIVQTADGGYMVGAFTSSNNGDVTNNHGGYDFWGLKIDATGNIEWQKTYGGSGDDVSFDMIQATDGGFVMVGYTNSSNGDITNHIGSNDFWVIKLTANGALEWQKTLGGSWDEIAQSVVQTTDGGYLISGSTVSFDGDVTLNQGSGDAWLTKLATDGTLVWQKTYGGAGDEYARCVRQTPDGGFITASSTSSFNSGDVVGGFVIINDSYWITKLSPATLANSDFNNDNIMVFPNPVSSILHVHFPEGNNIDKICITDISGKTIIEQSQSTNLINTQNLASGIYFLQATSNNKTYQTKFIKN